MSSRRTIDRTALAVFAGLFLWGLTAAVTGDGGDGDDGGDGGDRLAALRARCPDPVAAAVAQKTVIPDLLKRAAELQDDDPRAAELRLAAAEVAETVGDEKGARRIWVEVAGKAAPAARGEALYLLGQHYLLRERYADAWKYWRAIPAVAPESEWAAAAARYAPFVSLVAGLAESAAAGGALEPPDAPEFHLELANGKRVDREAFAGRPLLLEFWSAAAPRAREETEALRKTIDAAAAAGWDGAVVGVNLDRSREDFETAMHDWRTTVRDARGVPHAEPERSWPQHRDGQGFDSPVARAFGIPRAPMQVVIDARGRVVFLSAPRAHLEAALKPAER